MKTALGTFFELGSSEVIECIARSGMDYVIIDTEHGPFSVEKTADLIRAAEAAGIAPYVRIGGQTRDHVLRMLDVGAQALIVPNIESVEQVRMLVKYAKFAPIGERGYCPTRTSGWGADPWAADPLLYMKECNRRTKLYPQCETKGAYEHIEEIVALDGVDGIFVGPCDLSIGLGVPLQMESPVLNKAIDHIKDVCRKAGKHCMIFAGNPGKARELYARGFEDVTLSLDAMMLTDALRAAASACREK